LFFDISLSFDPGAILTSEMLQELNDFSRNFASIMYEKHNDGILLGAGIEEKEGELIITPGIIKYRGLIFRSKEPTSLKCVLDGVQIEDDNDYWLSLVLQSVDEKCGPSRRKFVLRPSFNKNLFNVEGIILACLSSYDGSFLPSKQGKVDMCCAPYITLEGETYHPQIFLGLKEILMKKKNKTSLDYIVLQSLLRDGVIGANFIKTILEDNDIFIPEDGDKILRKKEKLYALSSFLKTDTPKYIMVEESKNTATIGSDTEDFGGMW